MKCGKKEKKQKKKNDIFTSRFLQKFNLVEVICNHLICFLFAICKSVIFNPVGKLFLISVFTFSITFIVRHAMYCNSIWQIGFFFFEIHAHKCRYAKMLPDVKRGGLSFHKDIFIKISFVKQFHTKMHFNNTYNILHRRTDKLAAKYDKLIIYIYVAFLSRIRKELKVLVENIC